MQGAYVGNITYEIVQLYVLQIHDKNPVITTFYEKNCHSRVYNRDTVTDKCTVKVLSLTSALKATVRRLKVRE